MNNRASNVAPQSPSNAPEKKGLSEIAKFVKEGALTMIYATLETVDQLSGTSTIRSVNEALNNNLDPNSEEIQNLISSLENKKTEISNNLKNNFSVLRQEPIIAQKIAEARSVIDQTLAHLSEEEKNKTAENQIISKLSNVVTNYINAVVKDLRSSGRNNVNQTA